MATQNSFVIDITTAEQFNNLLQSKDVVVVKIWSSWCNPCKLLSPHYTRFAAMYSNQNVIFTSNNVETNVFTDVGGLPTTNIYIRGEKKLSVLGADVKKLEETFAQLFGGSGGDQSQQQTSPQQNELSHEHKPIPYHGLKTGVNGNRKQGGNYKSFSNV
jgi:thioredoxin 1